MEELNDMLLGLVKAVMDKVDPSGFLTYQTEILAKNGMPVQNIPKYLQEQLEWFETHDEKGNEEFPMPKISFDSEELKRLMRSEMNGD